jgi:iron complex outermembrane receptor protein
MQPTVDGAGTSVQTESSGDDESAPRADLGKPDENGFPNTLPTSVRRSARGTSDEEESSAQTLQLEEISTAPVSGAINRSEPVKLTPAYSIVLSRATLRARGYLNLSELLDDLPSVDVARSFGMAYANASFRGIRTGAGAAPYIVVVDGLALNSLFTGDAHVLASIPVSNVEQVEIDYGPAASYFGANAVMAVISITTRTYAQRQALGDYGATVDARVSYGGSASNLPFRALATKVVDATTSYVGREFVFRGAVRIEAGALDRGVREGYPFLGDAYYSDARLWGRRLFDAYPTLGGRFESPDNKQAVDARVEFKDIEVGYQYYGRTTGQGLAAPGDRVQAALPVYFSEHNAYVKHTLVLSRDAKAVTFLRHRASEIDGDSSVLVRRPGEESASFDFVRNPAEGPVLYQFGSKSASTGIQTDFTSVLARSLMLRKDELSLSAGLRYSANQIASDVETSNAVVFPIRHPSPNGGDCLTVDYVAPNREQSSAIPALPSAIPAGEGREYIGCVLGGKPGSGSYGSDVRRTLRPDLFGMYLSARYEFLGRHYVHAGFRVDGSTLPGSVVQPNARFAYIANYNPYTFKLLYGQASLDVSAFDRMGSRIGNTNAAVAPMVPALSERSHTLEAQLDATLDGVAVHAGTYFHHVSDPRSTFDDATLEGRQVIGGELIARFGAGPVKGSVGYSRMFLGREWGQSAGGVTFERGLGDIATDKVHVNATYVDGPVMAALLSRCIGARTTVPSNPVPEVAAYCTVDTNVMLRNLPFQGLGYGIRVLNALDTQYAHAGIGRADAGAGPGAFLPNGGYVGSLGVDSSLLPQPRRTIMLTLSYEQ